MISEPNAWTLAVGDAPDAARALARFIAANPNVLGSADIYNLDFMTPAARGGMVAAVLTGLTDRDHRPALQRFVVVTPPDTDRASALESARAELVSTCRALAARDLQPGEAEALRARLSLEVAADRRHRSVLDVIARQDERTAVIITHAASYRDDSVEPYVTPGATTPLQTEDVWAPQLHALAVGATALARGQAIYVALDANEPSPRRPALAQLLMSVEGCGVIGFGSDDDPETVLAAHVDQWDAWIREGRLGRALTDVDALPSLLDRSKAFLRIQLLYRAGHVEQALQGVRAELRDCRQLDASSRIKLARVAQDANAVALAREVLAPAIDVIDSREDLESALATARDAGLIDLEDRAAARLQALFPGSESLTRRHLVSLLQDRNYQAAAVVARDSLGNEPQARFYETLARHLSGEQPPDYRALIAEAAGDVALSDAYRAACARDALTRHLPLHALTLAMPLPRTDGPARRTEQVLLKTLEALLLSSSEDHGEPVSRERFQEALLALVERLAADPGRSAIRVGLVELMQPAVAGMTGLALMAVLVLQLAARPVERRPGGLRGTADLEWLSEHKPFLRAAFDWMKEEGPVVIGASALPAHLLSEPADEIVSAIASYLAHAPLDAAEDESSLLNWLALGAAVAPHSSDPDYDLRLMRLVAGKLASAGNVQQARDLGEQTLRNSVGSARRRRLGWFAMADIYARTGNHIEALLAMACTLAADDGADEEELYQEVTGVARLLRDCGLHDEAARAVEQARQLLRRLTLHDRFGHQLDTLELQLRQLRLHTDGAGADEVAGLLDDIVANGRDVLRCQGLTAPAAAVLGQVIRFAHARGIAVPPDAQGVFDELCGYATGAFATLLRATAAPTSPGADELLAAVQGLGTARYSDDVGFDLRNVALAASRALASDDLLDDPVATSLILDLLADRGVALPGWDEAPAPPPPPRTSKETADVARAVSRAGLSVVQAGFDENGHLVRLATVDGELGRPVREPDHVIREERVKSWAADFPFRYGVDETTPNLFYTTTADVRVSELPRGPVVVVADASLQAFPPNLLYVNGDFAGRTRPMAAAPSLAWLGQARQVDVSGDGRKCAWIPTAEDGENRTLPMIAERLAPTFDEHGFIVDRGPVLPAAFAGATLAVLAAHGGVHPEGRFFHVVSDEGSLRVTAADVANALRNVGVVVLFICSGGRADKHPVANTTLGLAKRIVDRGCQAVVASPWPLDARVPSHWLPTFLRELTCGSTLIEANFRANQVVDRRFAGDPARGLAMTVYGTPELRIPD